MTLKFNEDDIFWMRRALTLANTVLYDTMPNPRVGCVIVRNNQCISEGVTQPFGGLHAEICALQNAKKRNICVKNSTVYVNLEPCNHYGNTPPCVDALLKASPSRIVIAMIDPNPKVQGKGLERLKKNGISITINVCHNEALQLNIGFVARMIRGLPWVWLKIASSLDGRSALCNGTSKWITSNKARSDGYHWRARSCVVLTGIGTIVHDNPNLSVHNIKTSRKPIKAIVDSKFRIPENSRIFDGTKVLIFTTKMDTNKAKRIEKSNGQVILMPSTKIGQVNLLEMMYWFSKNKINEVHVEAGNKLSGKLLSDGFVDEILLYLAPIFLGNALPIVNLPIVTNLDQVKRLDFFDILDLGTDIRLRARFNENWQLLHDAIYLRQF